MKLTVRLLKLLKLCVISLAIFIALGRVANAYDAANLQLELSGAQKSKFYLCVNSVGCIRIDSNKQILTIDPINVRYIFLANTATNQIYPQNLPNSCNIEVSGNQKLVIKGKISKKDSNTYIANLHCSVIDT